jgi:hypothetical protein
VTALGTRAELSRHLVESRICGPVGTSREENLRNAGLCADREPGWTFGLEFDGRWDQADVVGLMAEQVGILPPDGPTQGQDVIDPERCLAACERMREHLATAARGQQRVLVATGHPTGLLALHLEMAAALAAAGCTLLRPATGTSTTADGRRADIRSVGGVAMVSDGASLRHTHDPEPMRAMLAALSGAGQPPPDLVVADHGYAGAAGQSGVPTVGFADCNDPALFVGQAEGRVAVAVGLDDNVQPHLYAPLAAFLLEGWDPRQAGP